LLLSVKQFVLRAILPNRFFLLFLLFVLAIAPFRSRLLLVFFRARDLIINIKARLVTFFLTFSAKIEFFLFFLGLCRLRIKFLLLSLKQFVLLAALLFTPRSFRLSLREFLIQFTLLLSAFLLLLFCVFFYYYFIPLFVLIFFVALTLGLYLYLWPELKFLWWGEGQNGYFGLKKLFLPIRVRLSLAFNTRRFVNYFAPRLAVFLLGCFFDHNSYTRIHSWLA